MTNKKQIIKDYKNGLTSQEIAKKNNCGVSYVYQVLVNNGIRRDRQRGIANKYDVTLRAIEDYLKGGITQQQVCVKYNIAYTTFCKYYYNIKGK